MDTQITRLVLTALAVVLMALPVTAEEVDRSIELDPDGTVSLECFSGAVQILGWDRDEVRITGTLGRDVERLDVDGSRRRVDIEVEVRERRSGNGTDLTLRVPRTARIEVETVSADVRAADLDGELGIESVSGRIVVADRPSRLQVETVSGGVEVAHAPPRSEISSVSGACDIAHAEGHLEAATVSGDITIQSGVLDGADVETVSGTIRCEAELSGRGGYDLGTLSGTVLLVVPAGIIADFDLSTFSGSISSQLGPAPQRTSRFTPGTELQFTTGAGGPRISIESFSGSIKIVTR